MSIKWAREQHHNFNDYKKVMMSMIDEYKVG